MDSKALSDALKNAAAVTVSRRGEEGTRLAFMQALRNMVPVLRQIQEANITEAQRLELWNQADKLISENCYKQYDEGGASTVEPFAIPTEEGAYIKSKAFILSAAQLGLAQTLLGLPDTFPLKGRAEVVPDPWSITPRPHERSTYLSRFTSEYNPTALRSATSSLEGLSDAQKDALDAVLTAKAEVHSVDEAQPLAMAIGKHIVGVTGADVWNDQDPSVSIHKRSQKDGLLDKIDNLHTAFPHPAEHISVQGETLWAATPGQIQAYSSSSGKIQRVLDSRGYAGMFGVTKNSVFRVGKKGKVALWKYTNLPLWFWRQSPSKSFTIKGLSAPLHALAPVPGSSSKWICSAEPRDDGGPTVPKLMGIRMFDMANPSAGASVVGLGLGFKASCLVTDKDMPNMFIAAGDDPNVRIYDFRQPLPVKILDGHGLDVNACTVAPFGGAFPIIFTGGKDELVKAWDVRYTKACLYSLSAGCLHVKSLAWQEEHQTLFVLGDRTVLDLQDRSTFNIFSPRMESFSQSQARDEWPRNALTRKDFFGKQWSAGGHALIEYRFRPNAAPDAFTL